MAQQMGRGEDLQELNTRGGEGSRQELDDNEDFLLSLVLERRKVLSHIPSEIYVVLRCFEILVLLENSDQGFQEFLAHLALLANERVPALQMGHRRGCGAVPFDCLGRDLLLVVKGFAGANAVTSVDEGRMFAIDDGMQRSRSAADLGGVARLQCDDHRERLQRMGQALLDGEGQDVKGSELDHSVRVQCCIQDLLEVPLNDSGTHTSECLVGKGIESISESTHPESAKPSVFPTSSSILTSLALCLFLDVSIQTK